MCAQTNNTMSLYIRVGRYRASDNAGTTLRSRSTLFILLFIYIIFLNKLNCKIMMSHCRCYIHQVIFGGRALFEKLPALPHAKLKGGRTGVERHVLKAEFKSSADQASVIK